MSAYVVFCRWIGGRWVVPRTGRVHRVRDDQPGLLWCGIDIKSHPEVYRSKVAPVRNETGRTDISTCRVCVSRFKKGHPALPRKRSLAARGTPRSDDDVSEALEFRIDQLKSEIVKRQADLADAQLALAEHAGASCSAPAPPPQENNE